MMFENRQHAALLLAEQLKQYAHQNPLIIAIPRGGVPLGAYIAKQLHGQLDVALVRKLGAPENPEYAIGAVAENGQTYISPYAQVANADTAYLDSEIQKQLQLIARRRTQYDQVHTPVSPANRIVIVVDDGLATGATMIAALNSVRKAQPKKLICAIPVAPTDRIAEIAQYCDELVCLYQADYFGSVGQFYEQFDQVDDQAVIALLADKNA